MHRWQKLGPGVTLVALLSVFQPAAAQAGTVKDVVGIIQGWSEGRFWEAVGWLVATKVGERVWEDLSTPEAEPPESTPTEPPEASLPPIHFDVDGITYFLNGEDAAAMEEGRRYDFPVCPPVFNVRLFISPNNAACADGAAPEESDYVMYREGGKFFYERRSP